jgi:hypothetical protein
MKLVSEPGSVQVRCGCDLDVKLHLRPHLSGQKSMGDMKSEHELPSRGND